DPGNLVRHFKSVTDEAWEADTQVLTARHAVHLGRRPRWIGRRWVLVRGDEREGDTVDVRVFGFEAALLVQRVGPTAQAPAHDLLAQELRAERAYTEDVTDGVGVPSLGQHGDGHDASDVFTEAAFLAHGVHDLAQEVPLTDGV